VTALRKCPRLGDMTSSAAIDVFEHGIEAARGNGHPPAGLTRLATREPNLTGHMRRITIWVTITLVAAALMIAY
jgi:hypothetical protein